MRPHLYKRSCPLVRPLVRRSVMLSSKSLKNGLFRIPNDLGIAGRGKKRDKRKEGRGEWKNEKVAKKWKMKKALKDASLASLGLVLSWLSSDPNKTITTSLSNDNWQTRKLVKCPLQRIIIAWANGEFRYRAYVARMRYARDILKWSLPVTS